MYIVSLITLNKSIKKIKYLNIDETEAMNYGVNRSDVTAQIQMMLRGVPVATFPKGKIPLSKIAKLDSNKEPSTITKDGLNYLIFINSLFSVKETQQGR